MSFPFSSLLLLCIGAVRVQGAVLPRAVSLPPANGQFDYQIGGAYTPASGVAIVSRDNTDSPAPGLYNICYINAYQTQPQDEDFWKGEHSNLLLKKANGDYFEDEDWEGEFFLDTSSADKRAGIAAILQETIDICANKGFDAIEPDNLDTFTRSDDLLTADNNLALAALLAEYAHSKGLAIAQKNTGGELEDSGKNIAGFDFAVAEECQVWSECESYTDVYGDYVIEIEYTDNGKGSFTEACDARGDQISVIYRDRDVVPSNKGAYHYEFC